MAAAIVLLGAVLLAAGYLVHRRARQKRRGGNGQVE
jgi:hypothetical protein